MNGIARNLLLGILAMACGFGLVYATYDHFDNFVPFQAAGNPTRATILQPGSKGTHYVINLLSGTEPIEMATVQHPDTLAKYQVYAKQLVINDTTWHQLRLGFFPDEVSAERVADLLRADYPMARVARASASEWSKWTNASLVALVPPHPDAQSDPHGSLGSTESGRSGQASVPAPAAMRVAMSAPSDVGQPVAPSSDESPTECDRLTAHPWDPQKLTEGIYWNKVPAARAVLACRLAVRANPSPRNMFQYARALAKSKEFSMAAEWYRKSADQGYVQAQYALGDVYEFGEGVQVNFIVAQNWYRKAAAQGYSHAADRLSRLQHASNTNIWQQTASAATSNESVQ